MALQVWLPLNKDGAVKNQGLANVNITSTAAYSASGKLGGSYYFSGDSNRISFPSQSWMAPNDTNSISIAMWVKAGSFNYIIACTAFEYKLSSSSFMWRLGNGGTNTFATVTSGITFTAGTWYHLCGTWDAKNKKLAAYVNGELVKELTSTLTSYNNISSTINLVWGGSWNINDFRFYDHCLSPKEVKEIAKGLVLHYPLNDAYLQSTTNLNKSIGTSWGYWGTNTVTSNSFTSPEGTQGSHVICSSLTSGGVYADHSGFSVKPSTTYVISAKMKLTGSTDYNLFYWREYDSSNTQLSASGKWSSTRFIEYGHGYKLYYGVVTTSSATNSVRLQSYFYGVGEHWIYDIQVEEGDYPTPFAGYNASRNETTVYDCSGYQNNGTASESLPYALNSPRYKGCYYFNTTSKRITLPTINMTGFADTFSISWWGNAPSYSNDIMYWGFSNGNHLNYYSGKYCNTNDGSGNPYYVPNTTTTIATPSINEWHHFVMVGDGSTNKLYMDGELYGIAKTYKGITGNTIVINGYDSSVNYKTNGYISDFRIYSTALSADDIKELHDTSCIINS